MQLNSLRQTDTPELDKSSPIHGEEVQWGVEVCSNRRDGLQLQGGEGTRERVSIYNSRFVALASETDCFETYGETED